MNQDFQERARELIKAGEGCIDHMYLDSVGNVTVGVGNMLPDADAAADLPFIVIENGEAASEDEIRDEYHLILEQEPAHLARHYATYCRLKLPGYEIDRLLDRRIAEFLDNLESDFEGFADYPMAARLGMLDMAFNLGNYGLIHKFPTFTSAARRQDWETCSRECRRRQIQDSRNREVKELFRSCTAPEPVAQETRVDASDD